MESVAWMTLGGVAVAGLIGLRLCRTALRSTTTTLAQQAAAGLIETLANCSLPSGVSASQVARVRSLSACALMPARSIRVARFHGLERMSGTLQFVPLNFPAKKENHE